MGPSGPFFPSWMGGIGSLDWQSQRGGSEGVPPRFSGTTCSSPGAGGGAGGTEEACPPTQGCGQELPVRFQVGGTAHLDTEKPFMARLPIWGELRVGVTQVRGRAGCGGHSSEGAGLGVAGEGCLGQSGSERKDREYRYPHFSDERTEVREEKGEV